MKWYMYPWQIDNSLQCTNGQGLESQVYVLMKAKVLRCAFFITSIHHGHHLAIKK